jgi:hypothetical protein
MTARRNWNSVCNPAFRSSQNNTPNDKTKPMKINRNLTFAALAALTATLLVQTSITRADDQGHDGHPNQGSATATFTKWQTPDAPTPEVGAFFGGIVGGDVGDGTFTGERRLVTPLGGGVFSIEADYHFHGSKHSFTARVHIVQGPIKNDLGVVIGQLGVVNGVVTDGWLKDEAVEGAYLRVSDVPHEGPSTYAFEGILEIKKASKTKE